MHGRRRRKRAAAGALTAALLTGAVLTGTLLAAPPASAAPRLQVSPGSGLPRDGATVTVTGSGYNPDGVGIYVAWCKVVPQYWTSADNCADARWVHTGGAGAGQAPMSPAGTFSVQLTISPTIGDTSCLTAGRCSVLSMAAHGSSDRSQDAFASVGFAVTSQPSKHTASHSTTPRSSAARPSTPSSSTARSTAPTKTVATTAITKAHQAGSSAAAPPATGPPVASAPTTSSAPTAAVMAAVQSRTGGGSSGAAVWLGVGLAAAVAAGAAAVLLLRRRSVR